MITVWRIALDPRRAPPPDAVAELSDGERARAARFVSDEFRNRWLHGHVAMRRILAQALGAAPRSLEFDANAAGKPGLASHRTSQGGPAIDFNFSDSGDLALLAVSTVGAVGVDVEQVRPQPALERITRRFFADEEREALFALPAEHQLEAFFRIWARKEAYIKAVGTGLAAGLQLFAVTIDADEARFVRLDAAPGEVEQWSLRSVRVPAGYHAAVATRRVPVDVEERDYRGT